MNDTQFIQFVEHAGASKGARTYNLHTQNASKKAVEALANTQYKALAKAHIKSAIVEAYKNNAQFKAKLEEVCAKYDIQIIA